MTMRFLLPLLSLACVSTPALASSVDEVAHGVVVIPDTGPAKRVRVLVYGDGRFRVTAFPGATGDTPKSLMVVAQPSGDYKLERGTDGVTLRTASAAAQVRLSDGHVRVTDVAGRVLLDESPRGGFVPTTVEGKKFVSVGQQFNRGTDEGLFGLGQHQNRQMDYNGEDVELAQHNMDIAIPFVVSTRGYGLLWDNASITRVGDPHAPKLIGEGLKVTSGGQPGWTARYYVNGALKVEQREATINYQFIRDQAKWPAAAKAPTVASADTGQNTAGVATQPQQVVWTGTVTPTTTGIHKLRLYASSYFKLFVNGKPVLDGWRQNWNPWFHNADVAMTASKPVAIRVEWLPNAGYLALFGNDPLAAPDRHSLWLSSELGQATDYYVVTGADADGVIAGYRALTGKAPLMPRWAYGFWQSRQRYETQEQLLGVLREYRRRRIPIDNMVQDWFYWPEDQWGSHRFDSVRFPDPQGMVDEIHALNARFMISVWPKFYLNTDNAKELAAKGYLYRENLRQHTKDWVGPGYENTDYDAYSPEARAIYYRQIKDRLVKLGIDAWWMDATEPDIHSNLSIEEREGRMGPTALGPGAELFNSYPLVHAAGVADGLRQTRPDTRPFILTRSAFGGSQRASAAVWSGDVAARWDDLRNQISAGVNLSLSGLPNWTHDIGGFAVEDRYSKRDPAALAEWRELNLRWFQFGAWSPLFRSHGEAPKREIFEIATGDPAMYDAMVATDRERYRLLPYLYGAAADTWWHDGTMMRGLVMDFAADRKTWTIDDEYMLGRAFLVAPVTAFKARSRQVYLPAGTGWYDWRTGVYAMGGRTITATAPRESIPLYVRAGSIVPTGPDVQYSGEQPDGALVLHVFTGTDGTYTLYDDDGTSEGYQKGERALVPIRWDEKARTLTIGARDGTFKGMPGKRALSVRFHVPGKAVAPDFNEGPRRSYVYDGAPIVVRL